jgi:hypothetical protein
VVAVERHELDEADLEARRAGELRERDRLLLGEVAQRHRVDLDRPHALVAGDRLQAAQHLRQRVAPGQLEEAVALERVDRHVDARDAGLDERVGVAFEQVGVGGQRQVLDAGHRREHRDQPRELASDERLAAGQAQVRHAHPGHYSRQPFDLLEGEDLGALQPGQPVGRHAVLAAEVAAIGDRDAQVRDLPAVAVVERVRTHPT